MIRSQNKVKCKCMPSCALLVPCLNKIGLCMSEKWLGTLLSYKMATSRPSWISCRNKMAFSPKPLCKPSFIICTPSLNNIGKCMSKKLLGIHLTKWPQVGHLGSDLEKQTMTCICKPWFFILLPSLNKIGKCMSEKRLRTC